MLHADITLGYNYEERYTNQENLMNSDENLIEWDYDLPKESFTYVIHNIYQNIAVNHYNNILELFSK